MNTKCSLYAEEKIRQNFQAHFYGRHVRSAATGVLVEKTTCGGVGGGWGPELNLSEGASLGHFIFNLRKTKNKYCSLLLGFRFLGKLLPRPLYIVSAGGAFSCIFIKHFLKIGRARLPCFVSPTLD